MSTAQSAHWIVGSSGTWYPADMRDKHLARSRGRRPEPIPGIKPGRWRVVRARGLPASERAWWYVERENCAESMWFPTWEEAQDYADRMARTREVVLPRGPYEIRGKQNIYEDPITVKPAKHLAGYETVAVGYTTHGVQNGFFLAQDEVRPLALALLALAEQEVRNEPS